MKEEIAPRQLEKFQIERTGKIIVPNFVIRLSQCYQFKPINNYASDNDESTMHGVWGS